MLCLGLFSSTALAADTHSLGYSSVDSGEIRWGGSSSYSSTTMYGNTFLNGNAARPDGLAQHDIDDYNACN